ncbi:MAG: hypothetical protein II558_04435, partial [Treponema sp.]|nr:hypothetical protein [Treponema sp.]
MQTDSGRFLRPLSLSKGRRTAKNSRNFPIRKNGKEAIFYGLSGVPASASIAYGNGYAAPPIPAVPFSATTLAHFRLSPPFTLVFYHQQYSIRKLARLEQFDIKYAIANKKVFCKEKIPRINFYFKLARISEEITFFSLKKSLSEIPEIYSSLLNAFMFCGDAFS